MLVSETLSVRQLGHFWNSFSLTNYDWNLKSQTNDEKKDVDQQENEEEPDARTLRKTKVVDTLEIQHAEPLCEQMHRH